MADDYINAAKPILMEAVKYDREHDTLRAVEKYHDGIEMLINAMK